MSQKNNPYRPPQETAPTNDLELPPPQAVVHHLPVNLHEITSQAPASREMQATLCTPSGDGAPHTPNAMHLVYQHLLEAATRGSLASTQEQDALPDLQGADPCTDLANAKRFVYYHGNDIRYCEASKTWFVWGNQRWQEDETLQIQNLAKKVTLLIGREAVFYADSDVQKQIVKWQKQSQSGSRINKMVELAKSERSIALRPVDFDGEAANWLLNVNNGTIDLNTFDLRMHRREDLITKQALVDYDPQAKCPLFFRFLNQIFDEDQELIEYVQRAFGSALVGTSRDDVLLVFYGTGANGKSTLLNVIKKIVGDYAMAIQADTLMDQVPVVL